MTPETITPQTIRMLVLGECAGALAALATPADELADDFDLRENGVIDSLGFIELIASLEQTLGVEIDLEALDPEQLTRLGPLTRFVAAQAGAQDSPAVDAAANGHARLSL